jgi:hypothetical protein
MSLPSRRHTARARTDLCCGGKVGALDVLAQVAYAGVGVVEQADAGRSHLAQVVRRHVGGHADGDAGGAVQQKVWHPRRHPRRLLQGAVKVGRKVHRTLVEFGQQQFGELGQLRLGVAHRRKAFRIVGRTEVALAFDQRVAIAERLRHQHHRLVAGGVAVRMELADHITHRARRLLRLRRRRQAELAHRVDDAPLYRLQAVAEVGQGTVQHHVHGVVEVGALGVLAKRNLFEVFDAHRGAIQGWIRRRIVHQEARHCRTVICGNARLVRSSKPPGHLKTVRGEKALRPAQPDRRAVSNHLPQPHRHRKPFETPLRGSSGRTGHTKTVRGEEALRPAQPDRFPHNRSW